MKSNLQLSESLLNAIMDSAVDAIIVIDSHGTVQTVNPATQRLFGYAPEQVIGQNVKMLMPPPFREEHDSYISNYLESGTAKIIGIGREVVGRRQDGSVFPIHLAVSQITIDDQILFAGIIRDISDLKRAEHKLAELNRYLEREVQDRTAELRDAQAELVRNEKLALLGQVSANISHEIRNPLNAAKTSAYYLMNAKSPTESKIIEHLERIDRQIHMIDNVITALTDLAKLPDPRIAEVDLIELVQQTIDSVDLPPDIHVVIEKAPGLPPVMGDVNQIAMVIRNLVRNARDAMNQGGGQLTISFGKDGQHLSVSVADNGCGIAEADLARIMDPFFSTKARGMGLGLAIIQAILEKNDGRMDVQSHVGTGSNFQIFLPSAS